MLNVGLCKSPEVARRHSPPPLHKPLHLIKPGLDFLGRINRRRIQTRMAEVLLHDVQRHALLDGMRSAGMAQPMGRSGLELFGIVRPAGFDHFQRHPGEAGLVARLIGEKVSHRLAQRPGSYVILKYVRPVISA